MGERIVEGIWDCPYCGTTAIGGLTKHCPNCGHPQDKDTTFRLGEKKRYLSDTERTSVGTDPDWACDYCDSLNNAHFIYCKNCGQPREKENRDYFQLRQKEQEKQRQTERQKETGGEDPPVTEKAPCENDTGENLLQEDPLEHPGVKKDTGSSHGASRLWEIVKYHKHKLLTSLLAILAVALFISGMTALFSPKQYNGTVSNKAWTREIKVEQYKTLRESGWSLPVDARLAYTKTEIRSYVQVLDHYEKRFRNVPYQVLDGYDTSYTNNGNGTFTEHQSPRYRTEYRTEYYEEPVYRTEPVYDTRYYYDVDRWVYDHSIKTTGTVDTPFWGEVSLTENERESGRTQHYRIYVDVIRKDKKKTYTYDCNQSEWSGYGLHSDVQITVKAGVVTEITAASA